jgi:hypothetical protein
VAGAFGLWSLAQRTKVTAADLNRTGVAPEEESKAAALTTPERRSRLVA